MLTLDKGNSYLIKTRNGHFYLGEFVGCEKHAYVGTKFLRTVEVFKDSYCKSTRGNLSHYNYLHLIPQKIQGVTQVEFDKAKFLNMSKPELEICFKGGI